MRLLHVWKDRYLPCEAMWGGRGALRQCRGDRIHGCVNVSMDFEACLNGCGGMRVGVVRREVLGCGTGGMSWFAHDVDELRGVG